MVQYDFLIETYETERLKTLSAWTMFTDEDLLARPHPQDKRGRSFQEQMVHQCVSEDLWFREILGIDVGAPPLPEREERLEFVRRYADDSGRRLLELRKRHKTWWAEEVTFFDVKRSKAWVMTRRMTHTAHHRGQLTYLLRMLGRELHSTYGPTADTGGLMQNRAPTIYTHPDLESLLEREAEGRAKARLPGPGEKPVTERPQDD